MHRMAYSEGWRGPRVAVGASNTLHGSVASPARSSEPGPRAWHATATTASSASGAVGAPIYASGAYGVGAAGIVVAA